MADFPTRVREDRRLVVLRTLALDTDYRLNERLLQAALSASGHDVSQDQLRTELDWLAEQELLAIESTGQLRIVTLTRRGLDVAAGRSRTSGVARPLPGDEPL